jgi:hypothetical protein
MPSAAGPAPCKLDEVVVGDVRPERALNVPGVDQDLYGYVLAHAMTADLKDKAEDVAESPWTRRLARAGLVAKGISFAIVAAIALKVAVAGDGKIEDRPGALHELAGSFLGKLLLLALAVGLAGYAFWRFAQALLGRELETGEREGVLKRIGLVARGALYSWLAFLCAELVVDSDASAGGKKQEDDVTAKVLDFPLGRWLVAAAGLAVMGAGAYNVYRGLSERFRKDLKEQQMGGEERRWYTALGIVGHNARGVVFLLAGFFLVRAAWQYDAKEAIGLDGALAKLAHQSYGHLLLGVTAAGLLAYALFSFVQARYREV